jgi:outer membrane protein OmpA-like peptidoglycan-associated protein
MLATKSAAARTAARRTPAGATHTSSVTPTRGTGLPARVSALDAMHRVRGNRVVQRMFDSLAHGGAATPDVEERISRTRGGGQSLQADVRTDMESALGADFGGVRLHTDAAADALARSLSARAFTTGRDIYFQNGTYDPRGAAGRHLLAHELTHVVQQTGAPESSSLIVGPVDDEYEREADRAAATVAHSSASTAATPAARQGAGGSIQRMCASCAAHAVHDDESRCPQCRAAGSRRIQRQPQPQQQQQPNRVPPGTHPDANIDPHVVEAVLTHARRALGNFTVRGRLTEPGNVITDITGIDLNLPRSTIDVSLAYDDRCNRAFQSALVGLRQRQGQGESVFNFSRSEWTAVGRLGLRIGSVRADGSLEASFTGSDFQALALTLTFTSGVSEEVPEECRRTPDRPRTPGGGGNTGGLCEGFDCSRRGFDNMALRILCCQRPPGPDTPDSDTPRTPAGLPSRTVYFFYDTPILKPGSDATLDQVFEALRLFPTLEVQITGHTSLEGTEDYNSRLSRSRAETARDLLSFRGIASSRIHVLAMGEYAPAVVEPPEPARGQTLRPAGDEAIRDLNRRAEIVFFDPTGTVPGVPTLPPMTLTVPRAFPRLSTPFRLSEFGLQRPSE